MQLINGILTGAPIWVWPLFVLLLWVGLRASRARETPVLPMVLLPLMGLLSLNAVNGLSPEPVVWVGFAAAWLAGSVFGMRYQPARILARAPRRVTLHGEWLTLTVIMVIFWMNFVGGIFAAVAPDVYASTGFHLVFAVIAGLASGSFAGRAVAIVRAPLTA